MPSQVSFRDRFFTRRVAETLLSPSSILLAGAGASVAIVAGLPLLVAPVAGLAAYAARVLTAMPKKGPRAPIDPFDVPEPWRSAVVEALKAQVRFAQAVTATEAGPIKERLQRIGLRIDDGIREVAHIARRGDQLTQARNAVDADDAARQLEQVRSDAQQPWAAGSKLERAADALQAQIDTAARLDALIADARARLRVLDARLDESVARAIELSVQVDDVEALGDVDEDVDELVTEMEALRQALEETADPGQQAAGA